MVINTNTAAESATANLQHSQAMLSKSLMRLSSGSKLVDASDDAAGLAVAVRLNAQVQRLKAVHSNLSDALSFTQTQDGYLKKIGTALQRMSELAMLSQDVIKSDSDRALYNAEYTQLSEYVTSAAGKDFNGVPLFSNSSLAVTIDSDGNTFNMNGIDLGVASYTNATSAKVDTVVSSAAALKAVNAAIDQLSKDRAAIGAYQTRLDYTDQQVGVARENLTAAASRIQDVDVAEETTEFAKQNILLQAGTAMVAQANSIPQTALKLLQQ
jgi:flagellin